MPIFTRGDMKLYYEEHGKGFPLLLIAPGGMRSAVSFWDKTPWNPITQLAPHYRVIAMDQRNLPRKSRHGRRRRAAEIAEPQAVGRRNAGRVGRDMAIENVNVAPRQALAQMIVAAPVAEAEFHHRAGALDRLARCPIEAEAQGGQPGDRAVEAAEGGRTHCRWAAASLSSH